MWLTLAREVRRRRPRTNGSATLYDEAFAAVERERSQDRTGSAGAVYPVAAVRVFSRDGIVLTFSDHGMGQPLRLQPKSNNTSTTSTAKVFKTKA